MSFSIFDTDQSVIVANSLSTLILRHWQAALRGTLWFMRASAEPRNLYLQEKYKMSVLNQCHWGQDEWMPWVQPATSYVWWLKSSFSYLTSAKRFTNVACLAVLCFPGWIYETLRFLSCCSFCVGERHRLRPPIKWSGREFVSFFVLFLISLRLNSEVSARVDLTYSER